MDSSLKLRPDSTRIVIEKDSIHRVIDSLNKVCAIQTRNLAELQKTNLHLQQMLQGSKSLNDSLMNMRNANERSIQSLRKNISSLSKEMEEQKGLLREKDNILLKKDAQLKDALHDAALNKVKLEGDINVNNTKVESKEREISYLQKSNDEKERLIKDKSVELEMFYRQKNTSQQLIDSLQKNLNKRELDLARTSEREKMVTAQYNDLQAKQKEAANRKKKIRFIQGVSLKNYRTPDWELDPVSSSSSSTYAINNRNAGKLEFDYITGISLSMIDLSKKDSKFTYDAGLFVGFGGQNLFKNFYIGPSFKIFDFFHLNVGANIAEYQQLKSGFNVGDPLPPGMSIPTVKEWKVNMYMGFTVDFELLTSIPKKL